MHWACLYSIQSPDSAKDSHTLGHQLMLKGTTHARFLTTLRTVRFSITDLSEGLPLVAKKLKLHYKSFKETRLDAEAVGGQRCSILPRTLQTTV